MKKYFQISVVVASFLVSALIRHIKGGAQDSTSLASSAALEGKNSPASSISSNSLVLPGQSPSTPGAIGSQAVSPKPTNTPGVALSIPTPTAIPKTTTVPRATAAPTATPTPAQSGYRDGTYRGNVADARYGGLQVQVTIAGGRIADVAFLQYPNHARTSVRINNQALPILKEEAIQAQSAYVDILSGASATSEAFQESLYTALKQAS